MNRDRLGSEKYGFDKPAYEHPPGFNRISMDTPDDEVAENPGYKEGQASGDYEDAARIVAEAEKAQLLQQERRRSRPVGKPPMQRQKTRKDYVDLLMAKLPSQNREFVNLVALRNDKKAHVKPNIIRLMDSQELGSKSTPATPVVTDGIELSNRSEPGTISTSHSWEDESELVSQIMESEEDRHRYSNPEIYAKGKPIFLSRATAGISHAADMLTLVKGQDSRMQVKRQRVQQLQAKMRSKSTGLPKWRLWWYLTTTQFKSWLKKMSHSMERSSLWYSSIKELAGVHGAHVGIYFNFMRWCLWLNLLLGLIWLLFVIVPYILLIGFGDAEPTIYYDTGKPDFSIGENAIGLFNGGAILNASFYFIGSYNFENDAPDYSPLNPDPPKKKIYDVRMAYLGVGIAYLLVSFYFIFRGVFQAIVSSTDVQGSDGSEQLSKIVFFRFDFSITNKSSVVRHKLEVSREIQDLLGDMDDREKYKRKMSERFWTIYGKRIGINLIILSMLFGSLYGIYETVIKFSDGTTTERLIPAVVLAFVNAAVPFLFEILGEMEEWRTRLVVIQVTILRSVILRIVGLYVFLGAALSRRTEYACWESQMGQEIYTLFIVGSLLFEMVTSSLIDIWVTIAHNRIPGAKVLLADPAYFDTIKKVMEMVYAQTVIWIGTFFCPVLPLVGIARVVVLFYLQKWSTMHWCSPKGTAFLAKYSLPSMIWYLMLGGFILAAAPLGYAFPRLATSGAYMENAWQERFTTQALIDRNITDSCNNPSLNLNNCRECLNPDAVESACIVWVSDRANITTTLGVLCDACPPGCGPFRNQNSAYETLFESYETWPRQVKEVMIFMGTATFTVIVALVLIAICCITQARSTARLRWGQKMELERDMLRLDKKYIVQHLQDENIDDLSNLPEESNVFTPSQAGMSKRPTARIEHAVL